MSTDTDWHPYFSDAYILKFSIPSQCWIHGEWDEDEIRLTYDLRSCEWDAWTEHDQNIKRDLDANDILSLREDFSLDRYIPD